MIQEEANEAANNKPVSASKEASNRATEAIKVGWSAFKERPWLSIGLVLLIQIATIVVAMLVELLKGGAYVAGTIFSQLFSAFVGMLLIILFFNMYDNKELGIKKAVTSWKVFVNYVVANILVFIAIIAGLILLIVPGVIIMFKLMFVSQLIVDKGMEPVEAIKKSWNMTKGHMTYILSVTSLLIGVILLGALAFIVGLLVALPVSIYAGIHAYRTVLKANE